MERVTANVYVAECLGDFWHVTTYALTTRAVRLMMCVRGEGRCVWTVRRVRTVTVKTQNTRGFAQIRGIFCAMHVVASETSHAMCIHLAGDKIISLHPVLVRGAVGKVCKGGIAQLVLFQPPVIL